MLLYYVLKFLAYDAADKFIEIRAGLISRWNL
jgi:hypothetical protein